MKKKIAVLFGGCSPEYPVSLKSACSVIDVIDRQKYDVVTIGITREGKWLRYLGDTENILNDSWHQRRELCRPAFLSPDRQIHGFYEITESGVSHTYVDAVFPLLHGKNGEDGSLQGLSEMAGIPVIGCGCLSSALCMDKYRAHQVAAACGIPVPKAILFSAMPQSADLQKVGEELGYPLFVKPLRAGSSFGITRVTGSDQLQQAAEEAFAYDREILLEENIDGFEVGCGILGKDQLLCGRADEIQLSCDFFDFAEKYTQKNTAIYMPARISAETERQIRDTAVRIFRALDCSGFARIDMFLTPDGRLVFNEVNTIPGLTSCSRFPNMMKGIGLSYAEMVEKMIRLEFE